MTSPALMIHITSVSLISVGDEEVKGTKVTILIYEMKHLLFSLKFYDSLC